MEQRSVQKNLLNVMTLMLLKQLDDLWFTFLKVLEVGQVVDKWTMSTPMIERRCSHSAVASLNDVYVLGGKSETPSLNCVEVFHTVMKQFSLIK